MAENSNIEWTDHTFNIMWGCKEVFGLDALLSACLNCYARDQAKRYGFDIWGENKPRRFFGDDHWEQPTRWNKKPWICEKCGRASDRHYDHSCTGKAEDACHTDNVKWHRARVFCSSMADLFEDYTGPSRDEIERQQAALRAKSKAFKNVILGGREEMDAARTRLWKLIEDTPNLFWQLLTKRPENMVEMTPEHWRDGWPENVIAMTTVENQATADERIPHLLKVPAKYLGLSCEPLLGPLTLVGEDKCQKCDQPFGESGEDDNGFNCTCVHCGNNTSYQEPNLDGIDWVICGGESGPKARPMHPDWARSLRDQCQAAGVPFFFKQWGEWMSFEQACTSDYDICNDRRYVARKMDQVFIDDAGAFRLIPGAEDYLKNQTRRADAVNRVGKKAAGRLLDGREWNEFPEVGR